MLAVRPGKDVTSRCVDGQGMPNRPDTASRMAAAVDFEARALRLRSTSWTRSIYKVKEVNRAKPSLTRPR